MKNLFILYCVSFDGAFVRDSEHETIEDAGNASADMGSKWYFYPFHVIVKGKTIVETGGNLYGKINTSDPVCLLSEKYKGKRFATFTKHMKELSKREELQNAGIEEFENELIGL